MRWSIRWQLVVPLLVVWLGVLLLTAWVGVATARHAIRRQVELQLRNVARTLSQATYPLTPLVLAHVKDLSGADCCVVEDNGRSVSTLDEPLRASANIPIADGWENVMLGPTFMLNDTPYLASGLRWRPPGEGAGRVLYLFYPEKAWQEAFWGTLRPALWSAILGGLVSLGVTLLVAERLTRRLGDLDRRTRLIAEGDFSPMPLSGWHDELRDLGTSINTMAERLQHWQEVVRRSERFRLLGQVSGGLAHQIRNGMTGTRLAVQLHARQCALAPGDETLAVALRQLTLLEEKLGRFLHLGHEDGARLEPCSFTKVVDESIELLRPQARHAHVKLTWHSPTQEINVSGDAGQLGHVVVNVITNAMEAAGKDGEVNVVLAKHGASTTLTIEDTGPGPPEAVAARLFEPFVTSRPGGVGLGLAVARQVIEQHGGTIAWERRDGRTCFSIRLPLTSETPHAAHTDH